MSYLYYFVEQMKTKTAVDKHDKRNNHQLHSAKSMTCISLVITHVMLCVRHICLQLDMWNTGWIVYEII